MTRFEKFLLWFDYAAFVVWTLIVAVVAIVFVAGLGFVVGAVIVRMT